MKFPTIEEMARDVAEKALDEYEYNGKTLRQWIEIILATDTNVGIKLSTNLASLGTDAISRQGAIDAFNTNIDELVVSGKENADAVERYLNRVIDDIKQLPPIQPKRGKWVLVCDNNGMHFICNKCGAWRYHQEQNFCGECGADMRGEQDD